MSNWISTGRSTYRLNVKSVEILSGVTGIGDSAFLNYINLETVDIPESMTSIGEDAFGVCTSLTSINVASDNESYSSEDGILYNKSKTKVIRYPAGLTDISFSILSSVTEIDNFLFADNEYFDYIIIPESATSIGMYAFADCHNLKTITFLATTAPTFGANVFFNCSAITKCIVPYGKAAAYTTALAGQSALILSKIVESALSGTDWTLDSDGHLTISSPAGMTDWLDNRTAHLDNVISVEILSGVSVIGEDAFRNCINLESVTIASSVTGISSSAFNSCKALESICLQSCKNTTNS